MATRRPTPTTVSTCRLRSGALISRSDSANATLYDYDGLNLVSEVGGATYIYDGTLMPRKAIIGGNEYYFQQDVLGNVTAITDANGDIVETYEYDVFGKPTVRDALGNVIAKPMTPFLMTGHYYDADVGIYITRYRAYSPDLGRWLTRDPIDFNGGDWNLYRYVENNPINYWDPTGLNTITASAGGTILIIGGAASVYVLMDNGASLGEALVLTGRIVGELISAVCSSNSGERNPAQDKKLSTKEADKSAQDAGYKHAHDAKKQNKGKRGSQPDLYRGSDGQIYMKPRGGVGPGEPIY